MAPTSGLTVSVIVPTRNRPQHVVGCAESILRNEGLLELIFVDQSDGDASERALSAIKDSRLRYVHSTTRGVTCARNVGIELSLGSIVAGTDDDCRVTPDWVPRLLRVFADDPEVAVVCGRVRVPEEIERRGFAIGFEPQVREWHHRFPPPDRDWGITANLAVRHDVLARVGPFDPVLGAGAPLRSGGEPDFLFRVLKAGFKVVNAAEVEVDHLGVRAPGSESRDLWLMYGAGTAAALFKHIRLGDLDAAALYGRHLKVLGGVIFGNLLHGKRPLGLSYTLAFLSGAVKSFRFRVDRRRKIYLPR
jgi:GT2 family glycosyltransferase